MTTYDIAVVGLGALGSAAAYHAALRGVKAIGFEQFEFGHVKGASHDTSRIFRTSNPLPEQVSLAKLAYKEWTDLEKKAGQELLTVTGGLVFIPKDGPYSCDEATRGLEANGSPYELLTAEQVNARWPRFQLSSGVDALYTADSGVVHASKSVSAMQSVARAHGAVLKEKTPVDQIRPTNDGVAIETPAGSFHAKKVILATDAWSNKLLSPLGAEVPLKVMQEQVTYFKPDDLSGFEPSKFPVWIWGGDLWFYGFPSYGEPTIKIARDTSNNLMSPENRSFVPSSDLLKELKTFSKSIIPSRGQTLRTVTCQYTITPGRQIIMSPLEGHKDVIIGLGAAIGFKYAPAIGRVLVDLALDGKSQEDTSKFGIPKTIVASKL